MVFFIEGKQITVVQKRSAKENIWIEKGMTEVGNILYCIRRMFVNLYTSPSAFRIMKCRDISCDGNSVLGNKKCIENYSDETSWRTSTCKTEREMTKNRSRVYLRKIGCEHPIWVDLAQDHVQW
jgi:hypothetical protein